MMLGGKQFLYTSNPSLISQQSVNRPSPFNKNSLYVTAVFFAAATYTVATTKNYLTILIAMA
jgi:hypothetical protein